MQKFLFLFIFSSLGAWANPICDNKAQFDGIFYSNFMDTSQSLQHGFVSYYQSVSKQFDNTLNSACSKGLNIQATTSEVQTACIKACDQEAFKFFTGILEKTKEKQKLLFNECSTLCNVTAGTIHKVGFALDENGCKLGQAALNVNDSESIKDISSKFQKNIKSTSKATAQ